MAVRVKSGGIDFYKARCSVLQGELEQMREALSAVTTEASKAQNERVGLVDTIMRLEQKLEEVKFQAAQAVELQRQVFVLEATLAAQSQAQTTMLAELVERVGRSMKTL
jgi:chromosome segregation ATPase